MNDIEKRITEMRDELGEHFKAVVIAGATEKEDGNHAAGCAMQGSVNTVMNILATQMEDLLRQANPTDESRAETVRMCALFIEAFEADPKAQADE